jgi:kumamolisin
MKYSILAGSLLVAGTFMLTGSVLAGAQESQVTSQPLKNSLVRANRGTIFVPKSSLPAANDVTKPKTMLANTNIQVFLPEGWKPDQAVPGGHDELPPFPGYAFETPASLACLYALVPATAGCNPNSVVVNAPGGSNAIALVEAYDDPWAGPDLAYFSSQFGLPFTPNQLQVYYQSGTPPEIDETGGWELEASLDIEYSHAMAPNATIYLVEANSQAIPDLLAAVQIASNLISCAQPTTCPSGSAGKGEVSMSWGFAEFPSETSYESYFSTPGVVYLASSGDSPGTYWPCVSPNVVCAGGTTIRRNPFNGNFLEERSWELGGGGASFYEAMPSYQAPIADIAGGARAVPDVALDSNPITGVWVWDSNYFENLGGGWFVVGGTSVAAPSWAGVINAAGKFRPSSASELALIYSNLGNAKTYNDTTLGDCGPYAGYLAVPGWDPCTGVGSARGLGGK